LLSSKISEISKISIIGAPAVGKTTMLKLLSKNPIDKIYIPTQGFDLKTVKYDNCNLRVWDFGGQKSYLKYLEDYLLGSDIVFIVTDSTPRNVLNSKKLIDTAQKIVENDCPIIAIANKQDLCNDHEDNGRMRQELVENILQVKTYGLTAINPLERDNLLEIIKKELNQVFIRRRLKEIEL